MLLGFMYIIALTDFGGIKTRGVLMRIPAPTAFTDPSGFEGFLIDHPRMLRIYRAQGL